MNGLVSTVQTFSKDIGVEFRIKKCGVRLMKRGEVVSYDGQEWSCQMMRRLKMLTKMEILEQDKIKVSKVKESFRREYLRRTKLVIKLSQSVTRYGADIERWTKNELNEIDRKTRKAM